MKTKSQAFIINCVIQRLGGRNANVSPRCNVCGFEQLKIIANNTTLKLICNRCYNEIHYMRINRND